MYNVSMELLFSQVTNEWTRFNFLMVTKDTNQASGSDWRQGACPQNQNNESHYIPSE